MNVLNGQLKFVKMVSFCHTYFSIKLTQEKHLELSNIFRLKSHSKLNEKKIHLR